MIKITVRSSLRTALQPEWRPVREQWKHRFSDWLEQEFDCKVTVIRYEFMSPLDYELEFNTPSKETLFKLKYAEYL